jgi:DNA-binding transcriptional ArsR family regulator
VTERQRSYEAQQLDRVCAALSHAGRRAILRVLAEYGPLTAGQLAACFPDFARQTVSQHLRVLHGAGLVEALRLRRIPRGQCSTPESRMLALVEAASVDGRQLRYRYVPHVADIVALWLAVLYELCFPPAPGTAEQAAVGATPV